MDEIEKKKEDETKNEKQADERKGVKMINRMDVKKVGEKTKKSLKDKEWLEEDNS